MHCLLNDATFLPTSHLYMACGWHARLSPNSNPQKVPLWGWPTGHVQTWPELGAEHCVPTIAIARTKIRKIHGIFIFHAV